MAEKQKNKKQGRNLKSAQNLRYKNERRHEQSHRRRMKAHLKRFPGDNAARENLEKVEVRLGIFKRAPALAAAE